MEKKTITLPAGTEYLLAGDIPILLANAKYPLSPGNSESYLRERYQFIEIITAQLNRDIKSGVLPSRKSAE